MANRTSNWMPWHIGDYLRDTMHLSTLQHGAYLLLLASYWNRQGPLPDDDTFLASTTRLGMREWLKIRPTIVGFFRVENGFWHQKRANHEIEKATGVTEARREAARTTNAHRHRKSSVTDTVTVPVTDTVCERSAPANGAQNGRPPQPQPQIQPPSPPDGGGETTEPSSVGASVSEAESVWSVWPKRIDSMAALVAIQAAIRRHGFAAVMDGTRAIVEADAKRAVSPPGRYLPKPTEFFEGGRYLDDPEQYGPRVNGSAGGVPLGIRVRDLADQLAVMEPDSRDWWKAHRELQALRTELLSADAEPLSVRVREGAELLRLHAGNPENAMGGSLEGKRKAEDEFRALRAKWKGLRKAMRSAGGEEKEP